MTFDRVTRRIRRPLLCCTSLIALACGGVATAQDATPSDSDGWLTEIVVTGTRMRGVAPVGSSVIAIGRDDIRLSGAISIDRMLREVPQVYDLGVSENSRGQPGGNGNIVWGNSVNLRGIGPYATLVIVDGHRVISNSRSIDPSTMPTLGVERLEVVADGASAIYGSDAIAGVVNIIPRRDLDGAEALARYGVSSDDGYNEHVLGLALGKTWNGGQAMLAYEHVYRSNLSGDDRDFFASDQTAFGGNDYRGTRCDPGTLRIGGVTYAIPAAGLTQANVGSLVAGTSNKCENAAGQDLFGEQEYDTLNGTFTQELTSWLTIFADGFYSQRDFSRFGAHSDATLTVPNTNAFFVTPAGFTGANYQIDYSFINDPETRAPQVGFARSWQVTPGFRVALPYDWQFEAIFSYGKNHDRSLTTNGISNGALNAALASSNPATAFDPYGLGRTSSSVLAGIANQIFDAPTLNKFIGYEARLNGKLFSLPGGDVSLAVGYEAQELDVDLGLARGNPGTAVAFRNFSRRVDSLYAEVLVPVVGDGNAMSGIESLNLNAAIRYDDYDDVGSTTNPKFGVDWSPIENLKIRGSYGTSFRAPLISQIYGNSNALFGQSYQDPMGGPPLQGFAYSGPNLGLGPETATTWSLGLDWEPVSNVRLSTTFFSVNYENQVETYLADLGILGREAAFAGTGIILRGTAAANRVIELTNQGIPLARGTFPGGNPANVTLFVDGRNNNLGRSITRGIDFSGTYTLDTDSAGLFTFDASGMFITTYKTAITAAAPLIDRKNKIYQPLNFKGRLGVTWNKDPFLARIVANYVGGFTNDLITPNEKVGAYSPIDLSFNWTLGDPESSEFIKNGFTLGLEVRNVLNEDPPHVNIAPNVNGGGGYDPTTTNPVGRLFAVTLRKSL